MSTNSSDQQSASVEARRGRGRPRDPAKREAILEAATALFFERGLTATTMDMVAERAGVAKMTVYAYFADKPALLKAVFARNTEAFRLPELGDGEDLDASFAALDAFGERLVAFLTQPEIVRSARMMAENANAYPELAAAFFAAGPAAVLARVARFLGGLSRLGVAIDMPELVAEQLVAAWLGVSQLRQNLGLAGPPDSAAIARSVRLANRALRRAWAR